MSKPKDSTICFLSIQKLKTKEKGGMCVNDVGLNVYLIQVLLIEEKKKEREPNAEVNEANGEVFIPNFDFNSSLCPIFCYIIKL